MSEDEIKLNLICTCADCGNQFVFSRDQQKFYDKMHWRYPRICYACRKKKKVDQQERKEAAEKAKWQEQSEQNQVEFEAQFAAYPFAITLNDVHPSDKTLYIIGNGFDLMHRVPSSYYAFRDSLGKHNSLRETLETYLTAEDIWADFEDALAHFNADMMANPEIIDMWLEGFDAFSQESAADYFAAIGAAVLPMEEMASDLPKRFRQWVETLDVGTEDCPLGSIIRKDGKVLDFNYTEFIETLYGVPRDNVCYIHGCRRKEKYHPKEALILGHRPGASDAAYNSVEWKEPKSYKSAMVSVAQEEAIREISSYDEELTKDCDAIIKSHAAFFDSLKDIEQAICIGHSFSEVDWPYFREIVKRTRARWICGCYGLRDFQNLQRLCAELGLRDVRVFRTDTIRTTPNDTSVVVPAKKENIRTLAESGIWIAKADGGDFIIEENGKESLRLQFAGMLKWACFQGQYLILVAGSPDDGVFLFSHGDDGWRLINELKSFDTQSLINARLCHVMVTDDEISFIYNNRIRRYALSDGVLIANKQVREARKKEYPGTDIKNSVVPRYWRRS